MRNFTLLILSFLIFSCSDREGDSSILYEAQKVLKFEAGHMQKLNRNTKGKIKMLDRESGGKDNHVALASEDFNRITIDLINKIDELENEFKGGKDIADNLDSLRIKIKDFDQRINSFLLQVNRGYDEEDKMDSINLTKEFKLKKNFSFLPNYLGFFRIKVLNIEKELQIGLSRQMGTSCLRFDVVKAFIVPESEIIEEGKIYRGQLVLGVSPLPLSRFLIEEKEIDSLDLSRKIVYSFKAFFNKSPEDSISSCDSIACRRYWDGELIFQNQYGEDTTYSIHKEYFVRDPNVKCR